MIAFSWMLSINLWNVLINSSLFIFNQVYYESKLDLDPNMVLIGFWYSVARHKL